MRLLISFSICLCLCTGLKAQTDEASIRTTLGEYFSLLGEQKISEALDYVHPELIGMIGKEMFENQYKQLFNSPGLTVTMDGFSTDSVSATFNQESDKYALVKYGFVMTFKVDMSNDEEGNLHSFLFGTYQNQYGKENVTSPEEGTYVISAHREMFATLKPDFEGWRILDYEPGMKMILASIIPEAVFTHFKK